MHFAVAVAVSAKWGILGKNSCQFTKLAKRWPEAVTPEKIQDIGLFWYAQS